MHKYILHIIVLLFTVFNVTAQVSFEARVSKKSMGLNERLRVDFIMNKNGDNFTAPNFSDFRVVGGPNQSISNSWVNGKRSFSKTFTYFLSPKKKGKHLPISYLLKRKVPRHLMRRQSKSKEKFIGLLRSKLRFPSP